MYTHQAVRDEDGRIAASLDSSREVLFTRSYDPCVVIDDLWQGAVRRVSVQIVYTFCHYHNNS